MGLYSVYDAPAEMRMKTLFEEGFGIFIMVFLIAGTIGIMGSEIAKKGAGGIYEYGQNLSNEKLFYSPDQLLGTIK